MNFTNKLELLEMNMYPSFRQYILICRILKYKQSLNVEDHEGFSWKHKPYNVRRVCMKFNIKPKDYKSIITNITIYQFKLILLKNVKDFIWNDFFFFHFLFSF